MNRRTFLAQSVAAASVLSAAVPDPIPIGLNTYCLRAMKWHDAPLLEYAAKQKLNAIFLQDSLDPETRNPEHWRAVRQQAGQLNLHLETGGGAILPKDEAEFPAMQANIVYNAKRAKAMGSPIIRSLLAGDRDHLPPGPVEQHMETAIRLLKSVRSQVMDLGIKVAIENHKDLQAWETRQVIETAGKEFVGSYLDTGNPSFVLESPLTTLEELGPYAVTVHLRDSVIYETARGVAVQWVPLGEGVIDFPAFLARMKEICPPVYVYIKPITGRPPQELPYLEPEYWKRYSRPRATDLSRFLAVAKKGRPYEGHMVIEDIPGRPTPEAFVSAVQFQQREHMERSIAYARNKLHLGRA